MLKPEDLKLIMTHIPADKLGVYHAKLTEAMAKGEINRVTRASAYLAHLAHESGELRFWEEQLAYRAEQLLKMWPKRYTPDLAAKHAGKPEAIANYVYANRMGNGNEASGDGWRYRGRSPIQITFKDAYAAASVYVGADLVAKPELAATPEYGFKIAAWFWTTQAGKQLSEAAKKRVPVGSNLNDIADKPDFEATTLAINGGLNGQEHRLAYYNRGLEVLGRSALIT